MLRRWACSACCTWNLPCLSIQPPTGEPTWRTISRNSLRGRLLTVVRSGLRSSGCEYGSGVPEDVAVVGFGTVSARCFLARRAVSAVVLASCVPRVYSPYRSSLISAELSVLVRAARYSAFAFSTASTGFSASASRSLAGTRSELPAIVGLVWVGPVLCCCVGWVVVCW